MTYAIGQLAQIIHVTNDLPAARHLYGNVFGGESYYEGYSPYEKRDASIFAIGDLTVEPMSPADEPGAMDMPVGRFLSRFGPRLFSVAINATGIRALADHLVESGVRVVGPGGTSLETITDEPPVSIYTHPRDTGFLIEFVDFGVPLMPTSPRLGSDWSASRWADDHPLGVTGWSHVTAVVRDIDASVALFTTLFGAAVLEAPHAWADGISARIMLGSESVIELLQPAVGSAHARTLERDGEGLVELGITVRDLSRAADALRVAGVASERSSVGTLVLDSQATAGAPIVLIEDPRPE